jgi:hypothetical protein
MTKKVQDADIYRKAAKLMESMAYHDLTRDSCCWAIALAKDPDVNILEDGGDAQSKRMKAVFAPRAPAGYWLMDEEIPSWSDDQTDHRILALCFMAAMVEAGDA